MLDASAFLSCFKTTFTFLLIQNYAESFIFTLQKEKKTSLFYRRPTRNILLSFSFPNKDFPLSMHFACFIHNLLLSYKK